LHSEQDEAGRSRAKPDRLWRRNAQLRAEGVESRVGFIMVIRQPSQYALFSQIVYLAR
jgi:hypothetical protein